MKWRLWNGPNPQSHFLKFFYNIYKYICNKTLVNFKKKYKNHKILISND